jgi:hypothetical protein
MAIGASPYPLNSVWRSGNLASSRCGENRVGHGYQRCDKPGHRHRQARAPVQDAVDAVAGRGDLLVSHGGGRTGDGHDQVSEHRDENAQRMVDAAAFRDDFLVGDYHDHAGDHAEHRRDPGQSPVSTGDGHPTDYECDDEFRPMQPAEER